MAKPFQSPKRIANEKDSKHTDVFRCHGVLDSRDGDRLYYRSNEILSPICDENKSRQFVWIRYFFI